MSDGIASESIHLSWSEIVWVAFMTTIWIFAISQNKAYEKNSELQAAVEKYIADITRLENENKALVTDKTELEREKARNKELQEENASLTGQIKDLTKANESLQRQLAQLAKDPNLIVALERERAKTRALQAANEALEAKNIALEAENKDLKTTNVALQAANKALEAKNVDLQRENDALRNQGVRLAEDIKHLQKEYLIVSRDMIDIKGSLDRVVCVVDCSSSMVYDKKRWPDIQRIVKAWLSHLDIKQLVLITYNDEPTVHTKSYLYVEKKEPGSLNDNLKGVIESLESVIPQSYSNTYDALERAYEFEPDTIILFTDGSPNKDGKTEIDAEEMDRVIVDLIEKHHDVPLNIVGLGDYFNEKIGIYLRKATELTGGTFIGR